MSQTLLQKIRRKVEGWGGRIEVIGDMSNAPMDTEISPFNLCVGVYWRDKILYIEQDQLDKPFTVVELIHESGHVFACKKRPEKSREWSFFGWEYTLAQELGCVRLWLESNDKYCLANGDEFGHVWPDEKRRILRERVAAANRSRIIVDGRAVAIR